MKLQEENSAAATYHGIVRAKCLSCDYESHDVTTLEMWNDYGVDCIENECVGRSEWELVDGSISVVDTDGVVIEDLARWADA